MKKKIEYYSTAALCSIVWDGFMVYILYQAFKKHPIATCVFGLAVIFSCILLNYALFKMAHEELKPKNKCFIMKLPEKVQNDDFDFPKLR